METPPVAAQGNSLVPVSASRSSADSQALKEHTEQFRDVGIAALDKPYDLEDLLVLIRQRVPTDAGAAQF